MGYASRQGRAHTSSSNPQAAGVCDRCGFVYQHNTLRWQMDWAGASLINKRILVCDRCYDTPQEQLRAIVIPADPVPIQNPRPNLRTETPPINTVAPVVTGTTTVGSVLATTDGTWTSTLILTYTYNWSGAGTNGSSTYTCVSGDLGSNITCTVTATSVDGSASQISNSVGPITGVNDLTWSAANLEWGTGSNLNWG